MGFQPSQIFDLSHAAREIATARRSEDTLPDPLETPRGKSFASDGASYESLVSLHDNGVPKNIAALFALRDIEIARDAGDAEGEENVKDRLRQACVEAGLSDVDVPIDAMIALAEKQHDEKYGSSEAQAKDAEAEYQGEGRS